MPRVNHPPYQRSWKSMIPNQSFLELTYQLLTITNSCSVHLESAAKVGGRHAGENP